MTKSTRTILFFSCVAVFVILCPILLAYSMGYAFDVNNKKIVPTGSISIKSIPKDSLITINGIATEKTTPALMTNLSAGLYEIEVFQNGYLSWNKTLEVKDFYLTVAHNILLFPENPLTQITTSDLQWISFAPSKSFAIGLQQDILAPLFLNLSINEMPAFSSIDNDYKIVSIESESISWSAKEKYVSFFAILNNGQRGYYFLESSSPQSITPIVSGQYSDLQICWHSTNDDILIYIHNGQLIQKNIISGEEIVISEETNKVFSGNNKIYFTQQDSGIIYATDDPWVIPSKNNEIKKEQFVESSLLINSEYDIINSISDTFLVHRDDGSVFLIDDTLVEKVQDNVHGIDINDQNKILVFNDHEINLVLEDMKEKQLIIASEKRIKKSFWMTENHVAYLLKDGDFFITELDGKGDRNTVSPIESKMEDCWISENNNNAYPVLYYMLEGTLYKVDWL